MASSLSLGLGVITVITILSSLEDSGIFPENSPNITACSSGFLLVRATMSSSSGRDGGHRILPSKRPHPDSEKDSEAAAARQEVVFVSVSNVKGPIGHAIYALPLPRHHHGGGGGGGDGSILRRSEQQKNSDEIMYPILEIPSDLCDSSMRCVKLKSRLYFIGGTSFRDGEDCLKHCSNGVCYIELDDVYAYASAAAAASGASSPLPPVSALLREGVPMTDGKPNCYAFVVNDKLYAIGPTLSSKDENQFEVFDPDTNQWSTLASAPIYSTVISHALIDNNKKLILGTVELQSSSSSFYDEIDPSSSYPSYFDMDTKQWVKFRPKTTFKSEMPALFAGGSLYFHSGYHLSSFGPIPGGDGGDFAALFDKAAIASSELSALIKVDDDMGHTSRIFHLGDNTFLYVMFIELPDPEYDRGSFATDSNMAMIRLVTFEVTGERFHDGRQLVFQTKLLHSVDYIARSKIGADFSISQIDECFLGSL